MKNNYFYGLGRRKSSTARVRLQGNPSTTLKARKGDFVVNGKPLVDYLGGSKYLHHELLKPFYALELDPENFAVSVKVSGGGHASQVDAIRLGIAKALVELNEDSRGTLRRAELLGRDPREKERKKFGRLGARKKQQYTKR